MRTSIKFSIISISLVLLSCFGIYRAYASIGTDAAAINVVNDCICGRIYQPVCASDMKTYANRCLFECARKKLADKGRSLTLVRSGVCGGEQLGRSQKLPEQEVEAVAAIDVDKDLETCKCDRSFLPVCGSDNRTYSNRCLFDCKQSILARFGKVLTLLRERAC